MTEQEWNEIAIKKLNQKGVRGADEERAVAMNDAAKAKAAKRKKPDKTVEDFMEGAKEGEVANDANWKDFATQQDELRHKELAVNAFWAKQDGRTLAEVYKNVFPGIKTARKSKTENAKAPYLEVIKAWFADMKAKEIDAAKAINVVAAAGLEREGTDSAKQREARAAFFKKCGPSLIVEHYREFSDLVLEDNAQV